jgi:hypothetical protein
LFVYDVTSGRFLSVGYSAFDICGIVLQDGIDGIECIDYGVVYFDHRDIQSMAYPFLSQNFPSVGAGAALDLSNEVDELLDNDELADQDVKIDWLGS